MTYLKFYRKFVKVLKSTLSVAQSGNRSGKEIWLFSLENRVVELFIFGIVLLKNDLFIYSFTFYVHWYFAFMYVSMRISNSLELQLQMSIHGGAGN